MRAIVLVGGFGTRLRPLTLHVPKQMLPVAGPTMLERVLERLAAWGVTSAVLSLGYREDVFLDAFPDGRIAGVEVAYAVEPEPLDTAGAIRFAALAGGVSERFVAVNGDVLTDIDVGALWREHELRGAEATIALTPVEDPSRYGVVPTTGDGRVIEFVEKPDPGTAPTNMINAGCYVLEPSVLERIPGGRKVSIERETFPALASEGSLYAMGTDEYWVDAGTPATYLQASFDLVHGLRGVPVTAVAPDAEIHPAALVSDSVIHGGVRVGAGARVEGSILLPGTEIAPGAVITGGSIVGGRCVVGEGCELSGGVMVGYDVEVPAGTQLSGGAFPPPDSWS